MNKLNNAGPNTDPCDTPLFIPFIEKDVHLVLLSHFYNSINSYN